jgi:uncharacterized pyridoxal phosphate-containing UPF0001 family protein
MNATAMTPIDYSFVPKNFLQVQGRIQGAAASAGRNPAAIRLVVVTKGHPLEAVEMVITAGALDLGENYVEEGLEKKAAFT